MAETAFHYHFSEKLAEHKEMLEDAEIGNATLLGDVVDEAVRAMSLIEQFQQLPPRNQTLITDMAGRMFRAGNQKVESTDTVGREHFWGLYLIGSRAKERARADSDVDLLSVGTFGTTLNFVRPYEEPPHLASGTPLSGFRSVRIPSDELPNEYNVGEIERKYWVMASWGDSDILGVDLAVVDLTDVPGDLDSFENDMDVDAKGRLLPRIPLVSLTVAERPMIWHP